MDRIEVWEHVIEAITREFERGEFEPGEFRVDHNRAAGTITVIEPSTNQALQVADISGSYCTGGANEDDPVHIIMPIGELAKRMNTQI